eukprot:gene3218-2200_t
MQLYLWYLRVMSFYLSDCIFDVYARFCGEFMTGGFYAMLGYVILYCVLICWLCEMICDNGLPLMIDYAFVLVVVRVCIYVCLRWFVRCVKGFHSVCATDVCDSLIVAITLDFGDRCCFGINACNSAVCMLLTAMTPTISVVGKLCEYMLGWLLFYTHFVCCVITFALLECLIALYSLLGDLCFMVSTYIVLQFIRLAFWCYVDETLIIWLDLGMCIWYCRWWGMLLVLLLELLYNTLHWSVLQFGKVGCSLWVGLDFAFRFMVH